MKEKNEKNLVNRKKEMNGIGGSIEIQRIREKREEKGEKKGKGKRKN